MDSYSSHVTPKILSKMADNEISLVMFPLNTTHLLLPLDDGVYKPLKEGWRKKWRSL
jgi:hypothetical protein